MTNSLFFKWMASEWRSVMGQVVAVVCSVVSVFALRALHVEQQKEPLAIRIRDDGSSQAVMLSEQYAEPNEAEVRWFSIEFASRFMLGDSFSVRQDFQFCALRMAPKLSEQFIQEAKGNPPSRPGALFVLESLKRRSDIPRESVKLTVVDKKAWPWRVEMNGERQVLDERGGSGTTQKWDLQLEVVRSPRTIANPSGLLIWSVKSAGRPVVGPDMGNVYRES